VAALKGKQKTRPAALNKSFPLCQADGFLTNAAANVAMALTVFIASSTPRSTNPQVKETLMAEPLSPAAQAVLDAAFSAYWSAEQEAPNDEGMIAAAALRAASDQVVPPAVMLEYYERNESPVLGKALEIRGKLLSIAAELEAKSND
jgi:hypothetical protein